MPPSPTQSNFELHRDERSGFSYRVPDGAEVEVFRAAIEALPVQVGCGGGATGRWASALPQTASTHEPQLAHMHKSM